MCMRSQHQNGKLCIHKKSFLSFVACQEFSHSILIKTQNDIRRACERISPRGYKQPSTAAS